MKILGVLGGKCGVRFLLERVTDISAFGLVLISDWLSPGVRMRTVNSMVNSAVNSLVKSTVNSLNSSNRGAGILLDSDGGYLEVAALQEFGHRQQHQ